MGEVGRTVQILSNHTLKIPHIVGLDPAAPASYPLNPYVVALNNNDGKYQICIISEYSFVITKYSHVYVQKNKYALSKI